MKAIASEETFSVGAALGPDRNVADVGSGRGGAIAAKGRSYNGSGAE